MLSTIRQPGKHKKISVIAINRSKNRDQNPPLYANSTGVDGRIILRWIFRKWEGMAWTGSIWLKTGTGGGFL